MSLLFAILALFVGPVFYRAVSQNERLLQVIDGFIFIAIGGLVLQHVLPATIEDHGLATLGFLLLGFLGPNLLEGRLGKQGQSIHSGVLLLGVVGLAVHAALDGAALVSPESVSGAGFDFSIIESQVRALPLAIILHRLAVGLTLWCLISPHFGRVSASASLLALALMTVVGYWGADTIGGLYDYHWLEFIQAMAAGAILHVVVFRFHLEDANEEESKASCCCASEPQEAITKYSIFGKLSFPAEGVGNLLGLALIGTIFLWNQETASHGSHSGAHAHSDQLWDIFRFLFSTTALALLLAYVAGGLLFAYAPVSSINWLKNGGSIRQFLKGLFVGLPLPVCSCGVLPLYQTLVKRGVPSAAALAFLLATPELGIDAFLISFPLLGFEMTMLRLGAVVLFTVGVVAIVIAVNGNLTLKDALAVQSKDSLSEGLEKGFWSGCLNLVENTGAWILVGLLIAAIAQPLLSANSLSFPFGTEIILVSLAGVFLYVCAAGSTPFVAVLIANGLSPGAAIAFLLTGPATNVSTFGVIANLHGKRFSWVFCLVALSMAVLIGYSCNFFFEANIELKSFETIHQHENAHYQIWASYLLSALLLIAIFRGGARKFFGQVVGKILKANC